MRVDAFWYPDLYGATVRCYAGEAVALVDSFWFSDLQLASAIGRYDGQAYLYVTITLCV